MWSPNLLVLFLLAFISNFLSSGEQVSNVFVDKYYDENIVQSVTIKSEIQTNKTNIDQKCELNNTTLYSGVNTTDDQSVKEDFLVQHGTNFGLKNVNQFGPKVKYNKTEHVHFDNALQHPHKEKKRNIKMEKMTKNEIHSTSLYGSYVFPYVDQRGSWQVMRESEEEMFPKGYKPRTPSNFRVNFYLFTRENGENLTDIRRARQLVESDFSGNRKTIFIIHGWQNGEDKSYILSEIRKAFLKAANYNIFMVDWSKPSWMMNYFTASHFTQVVGNKMANFIRILVEHGGASLEKIKIVGHSLGAHAAGIAGKRLKGKLRSIVGLDPARLLFSKSVESTGNFLHRDDAQYVEVIHTSLIGIYEPIGDVDFYFNNGYGQPKCLLREMTCDHSVVNEYFLTSILYPREFELQKCGCFHDLKSNTCAQVSFHPRYMNGKRPNRRLRVDVFNIDIM